MAHATSKRSGVLGYEPARAGSAICGDNFAFPNRLAKERSVYC